MQRMSIREVCERVSKRDPQMKEKLETAVDCLVVLGSLLTTGASGGLVGLSVATGGLALRRWVSQTLEALLSEQGLSLGEVLNRLARHVDEVDRYERMTEAYTLAAYAAFFDARDRHLATLLREHRLLTGSVPSQPLVDVISKRFPSSPAQGARPPCKLTDRDLTLPHPADPFEQQRAALMPLFGDLCTALHLLLHDSTVCSRPAPKAHIQDIVDALQALPAQCMDIFQSHYLTLCAQLPEFAAWAGLQRHAELKLHLEEVGDAYWQAHLRLSRDAADALDIGLRTLYHHGEARKEALTQQLEALPAATYAYPAHRALRSLSGLYQSRVERPVVEDEDSDPNDPRTLRYPRRSEAFIPQAFKVLRVTPENRGHLGDERTWQALEARDDLGTFLVELLASPHSWRAPVIILGHPGSGKSLLTHVLAAHRIPHGLLPIRVPLRATTHEDIDKQVVEAVERDTHEAELSWSKLEAAMGKARPLVLLDGYDELLQVSGALKSNYLDKVKEFQQNRLDLLGAPVRCVVTSRVTLIDKARVPLNATILRLEPFDARRQQAWMDVWNSFNAAHFAHVGVQPFQLPDAGRARLAHELAEQPLLLLLLALYDAQDNALARSEGFDRAQLYEALIQRFVRRELEKDAGFRATDKAEQQRRLNTDIDRISIVAVHMLMHRSTLITDDQLRQALGFFQPARAGLDKLDAVLLLGSFFFIHQSEAEVEDAQVDDRARTYEFLHNTFGEYLAARWMVGRLAEEMRDWLDAQRSPRWAAQLEARYGSLRELPETWYAPWSSAPLFEKRVVVEMMGERFAHVGLPTEGTREALDLFITRQLRATLEEGALAPLPAEACPSLPPLGRLALYSMNLVIARTWLLPEPLTLAEGFAPPSPDGGPAWERLTHLWQGWIPPWRLRELNGFIRARREDGVVVQRSSFKPYGQESGFNYTVLDDAAMVADAIDDPLTAGLVDMRRHVQSGFRGELERAVVGFQRAGLPCDLDRWILGVQHSVWEGGVPDTLLDAPPGRRRESRSRAMDLIERYMLALDSPSETRDGLLHGVCRPAVNLLGAGPHSSDLLLIARAVDLGVRHFSDEALPQLVSGVRGALLTWRPVDWRARRGLVRDATIHQALTDLRVLERALCRALLRVPEFGLADHLTPVESVALPMLSLLTANDAQQVRAALQVLHLGLAEVMYEPSPIPEAILAHVGRRLPPEEIAAALPEVGLWGRGGGRLRVEPSSFRALLRLAATGGALVSMARDLFELLSHGEDPSLSIYLSPEWMLVEVAVIHARELSHRAHLIRQLKRAPITRERLLGVIETVGMDLVHQDRHRPGAHREILTFLDAAQLVWRLSTTPCFLSEESLDLITHLLQTAPDWPLETSLTVLRALADLDPTELFATLDDDADPRLQQNLRALRQHAAQFAALGAVLPAQALTT